MTKTPSPFESDQNKELVLRAMLKLLAASNEKVFIKDKDLIYRGASPRFARMAGWESETDLLGKTDFDIFADQELAQRYHDDDQRLIEQKTDLINYVEPITELDGHARFASTSKFYLTTADGAFLGIAGISRDVTQEYYLKRHSNRVLEYLFDLPENAYFAAYIDLNDWRIVNEYHHDINHKGFMPHSDVDRLAARAYERIADRRWPAAVFWNDFSRDMMVELFNSGKHKIMMEYRRAVGEHDIRWVRDEIHLLQDNVNGHLCMMLVVWDVQKAKTDEEERIRMAERDELTGLLNRKATMTLIRERLENSFDDEKHALLMIDMDYFKNINDTYGHQAGDKALAELAVEIGSCFRSSDIVGRIGGDEFFVLMTHVPDRRTVEKKLDKFLEQIKQVHYEDIYLSASIGVSIFPDNAGTLEDMYALADKAMYAAKETRGLVVFAEDMKE